MYDIVTQEKMYNEYITPGAIAEIKARSKVFDMIKKSDKLELGGLYAKQKMIMVASQANRASNNSTYPTAQESDPAFCLVRLKRAQMLTLQFDGMAMALAKKRGTPIDPQEFEKKGIFISVADDLSRQLMGDGSGRICQVNGVVTGSQTVYIDSPYWAALSRFLKKKRIIDIYNATPTKQADSQKIAAIVSDAQITMESAITVDDNSYIYNEDTYPGTVEAIGVGEMMGLLGIISDADPPVPNAAAGLQGLLVGSYPEWKANVLENGGVKRPLTEDLLTAGCDAAFEYGSISVFLTTLKVRRIWASYLSSLKTLPNQKALWGGWEGLPFIYDGKVIPMVPDRFVPDGFLFGLDESQLTLYVTQEGAEIEWEKGTDGGYLQKVASKNEFVSEGHIFMNLGTGLRKAFVVVKDLEEPTV
jgi:hypothetical protein